YPSPERLKSWDENPKLADDFRPRRYLDQKSKTWIANAGVQADDIHVVNEVHVWKGVRVLVHLATKDVIHSFYLPNLRLKQDALPGKVIPVWFEVEYKPDKKDFWNTKFYEETGKWEDGYDPIKGNWGQHEQSWDLVWAVRRSWGQY